MKKKRQAHNRPSRDDAAGTGEVQAGGGGRPAGASHPDAPGVSNDEYFRPFLQASRQKQVEARVLSDLESVPQRLNITRRQFLATSAVWPVFTALNEVFRDYAHDETLFRLRKDSGSDHQAFLAAAPPPDLFVFDDQCHLVRGSHPGGTYAPTSFLVLAQGESARFPNSPFVSNPWNLENHPDEHGNRGATGTAARDPHRRTQLRRPGRESINAVAGSIRVLSQGIMYMGPGNLWCLRAS